MVNNFDTENNKGFLTCVFDKNEFSVMWRFIQGKNNRDTTYAHILAFEVKYGSLDFKATDISAPHLEDVKAGKVTEGMNPDEVRIVMGAPWEERKSGDKIRWIYGNEGVVIFVDGKVSRVVMSR